MASLGAEMVGSFVSRWVSSSAAGTSSVGALASRAQLISESIYSVYPGAVLQGKCLVVRHGRTLARQETTLIRKRSPEPGGLRGSLANEGRPGSGSVISVLPAPGRSGSRLRGKGPAEPWSKPGRRCSPKAQLGPRTPCSPRPCAGC